jgi:SAM-dependent methyltransferase
VWGPLVATATLVAAGAVFLYAGLIRLFAVLHEAPSVSPLVLCAVSGAVAGAFLAHRTGWHPAARAFAVALGAAVCALCAVLAAGALVGLAWLNLTLLNVVLAYLAFAGAGAALASPFAVRPARAGLVAAAELGGAAVAALATGPLQDLLGPMDAVLLAAALSAAGALLAIVPARLARGAPAAGGGLLDEDEDAGFGRRLGAGAAWGAIGLGVLAGALALPLSRLTGAPALVPATANSDKSLYTSIRDPQQPETVAFTTWSSAGRTDVTEPASTAEIMWVYLDGAPVGFLPRGGTGGAAGAAVRNDLGSVPFQLPGGKDRVLIVGAGGGQEVLTALAGGAQEVVATESGPGTLQAQAHFSAFTADLLGQPQVRVVPEDGRTYLRNSGERFDVIYLTLSTLGTAEPGGGVQGSYLYTLEAFDDYLRHLRPDGRLVVKLRDEPELLRAFDTAFQALSRRGASPLDAIRRVVVINNGPAAGAAQGAGGATEEGQGVALPLLIVRQTPYLEDEARQIYETLRQTPYPPLFVPYLEQMSPVLAAFAAEGLGPEAVESRAPYQVRPATDASPFFFDPRKGPAWEVLLALLLVLLLGGGAALLARRPGVEAIEAETDVPDAAVAFLEDEAPRRFVVFTAVAGAGFALVLYPLLFRLPLTLGWAVAGWGLLTAGVLAGAAAGGLLIATLGPRRERPAMGWATLAGALLAVALLEVLPMAEEATRGQPLGVRAAAAALLLIPLGLCAGVPYPAGVRTLDAAGRGAWATLLWGVLALGAVCGVLLAHLLGAGLSFTYATLLGAGLLFAAFLMAGLRWLAPAERVAPAPAAAPAPDLSPYQRPA